MALQNPHTQQPGPWLSLAINGNYKPPWCHDGVNRQLRMDPNAGKHREQKDDVTCWSKSSNIQLVKVPLSQKIWSKKRVALHPYTGRKINASGKKKIHKVSARNVETGASQVVSVWLFRAHLTANGIKLNCLDELKNKLNINIPFVSTLDLHCNVEGAHWTLVNV